MDSETQSSKRGVAMLVVLAMVVFFTMLGYMGIEMAGRDTQVSGTYLDITSRDVAGRSALQLGLARLTANPERTAAQLQMFVADSAKALTATHQYMVLGHPTCSLQVADPGFYALGTQGDHSAVKVQILSADLGTSVSGSQTGDGIRLSLLVTGRGRNGDIITSVTSYEMLGADVPAVSPGAPTMDNAVYVNGGLPSTNVGNKVTGNMYVAGDMLLNGPATLNVSGKLRVNGNFTSNAIVTAQGNVVVGGDLYTNASAPMTFNKNLVIKGGFSSMNGAMTVVGNVEVGSNPVLVGNWNSTAPLTVGGQFWEKTMCHEFGAKIVITGNAFFDNCFMLNSSGITSSLSNLYLARTGGTSTTEIKAGTLNITGSLASWATGGKLLTQSAATTNVTGNVQLAQPLDLGGAVNVTGAIQLWGGIADIRMGSPTALSGGTSTFLQATGQRGNFTGGVTLNGPLTTKGTLDAAFSNAAGNSRWTIAAGAASRSWNYENAAPFSTGLDPRVLNATTSNNSGWAATGTIATPANLVALPVPLDPTAYPTDPYSVQDLDLAPSKTWNQVYRVDSTVLKGLWTDLTNAAVTAAGVPTSNWTAANMMTLYNKYKNANGWLIARIPTTSSMSALNAPGATFTGKAIWIIEKSIDVNGNWPGSTSLSDIQMIYVRGALGAIKNFGSPAHFTGYIHLENPYTGQMMWGGGSTPITLTGALHLRGSPTNLTGNGGNTLAVTGSQSVMDQIQLAAPGVLVAPGGVAVVAGSTNRLVVRESKLRFRQLGEYR